MEAVGGFRKPRSNTEFASEKQPALGPKRAGPATGGRSRSQTSEYPAPMELSDFIAIAFSTFFGATVAFLAERLTHARAAKLAEEAALNNLILDLAGKRAFLVSDGWKWADGEMAGVVESVRHVKSLIRDARLDLRPRSRALPCLRQMGRACNTFLESSKRDDEGKVVEALKTLKEALSKEVTALHSISPKRILDDQPGSGALTTSL